MRQVIGNAKLKNHRIRFPDERRFNKDKTVVQNWQCSEKVADCGKTLPGKIGLGWETTDCHRFYKCHNGVAYSCQNPKLFSKKCSEQYHSIGKGKEHYKCPPDSPAQQIVCNNNYRQ